MLNLNYSNSKITEQSTDLLETVGNRYKQKGTNMNRSGKGEIIKRFLLQKTRLENNITGSYSMKTHRKSNEQLVSQ